MADLFQVNRPRRRRQYPERSGFLSLSPFLTLLPVLQAVINTMCGFGVQTQNHLETNKSIYPVGCADKAVMWIESHLLLVGALALGMALPQVRPCSHTRLLPCTNWLQRCDISNPERVCAEITRGFSYLPSLTCLRASAEVSAC